MKKTIYMEMRKKKKMRICPIIWGKMITMKVLMKNQKPDMDCVVEERDKRLTEKN